MVKVSVIVPVYNVEKYLEKCINSLLWQTLKDIEIIFINDSSTDSSGDILEMYALSDTRIKIINQSNSGQSAARNAGILAATGEFLGFVDSDDWVDKDYFEKLYWAAKNNNCEMAVAGFKRCKNGSGNIRKRFKKEEIFSDINSKIAADNLPKDNYIWNKIYNRESWIKHNFKFEEGRSFEDVAILIKIMYKLGNMVSVPNTYYHYRKRPSSTVTIKTDKNARDFRWAKKVMYDFAEANNVPLEERVDYNKKVNIKIFNVTVLKMYCSRKKIKYKLFGFIPFMTQTITR